MTREEYIEEMRHIREMCRTERNERGEKAATEAITLRIQRDAGAVWSYYTNDEGRARWRCSYCGKICRRNPHDKRYCSHCGKPMRMEG